MLKRALGIILSKFVFYIFFLVKKLTLNDVIKSNQSIKFERKVTVKKVIELLSRGDFFIN